MVHARQAAHLWLVDVAALAGTVGRCRPIGDGHCGCDDDPSGHAPAAARNLRPVSDFKRAREIAGSETICCLIERLPGFALAAVHVLVHCTPRAKHLAIASLCCAPVRFRIPSVQAGRLRPGEQFLLRSALSFV